MRRDALSTDAWDDALGYLAGGTGADTRAKALFGENASAADLFAHARAGSRDASEFVCQMQEYLAMAIAYFGAILDPEAFIFGGGVANAQGEWFLDPIREMSARFLPGRPEVRLSALGSDAQLFGAARIALDACLRD
jgi:glucokinase